MAKKSLNDIRLVDVARTSVARSLASLDYCVRTADEQVRSGPYKSATGSHVAYLAEHATRVLDNLRKLEAHEEKKSKALTDAERHEMMLEYLADAPDDFRARALAALEGKSKSVL